MREFCDRPHWLPQLIWMRDIAPEDTAESQGFGWIVGKPDVTRLLRLTVAVGTVIADRPPHRSVRARLRIRLLRRMSGVEASIGIRMQDAGWWNPPCQDWSNSLPSHLCALTAAD
jgi:hypothetical protein